MRGEAGQSVLRSNSLIEVFARVLASDPFRRVAPFEERLLRTPIPQIREALADLGAPLMRETYGLPAPRRGIMPLV